jgi:serine/threonine protein kinase
MRRRSAAPIRDRDCTSPALPKKKADSLRVYRATDVTRGRIHHELRTARQLTHPNVCRVYDIGEADGHTLISMEYVDGVPSSKALEITRKLCAGLAAAHAAVSLPSQTN